MYGNTVEQIYSNENPSTIKTKIETWFEGTDLDEEENLSKLEDVVYCNDRSVEDITTNGGSEDNETVYYSSYIRRDNGTPALSCRGTSGNRDRFTYKDTVNGNELLKWPVGLLSVDEIMLAGGYGLTNSDYYLYTGVSYWTLSPSYFYSGGAYEFYVYSNGSLYGSSAYNAYGVRPVVSLAAGTRFTGGGTDIDPYKVK